MSIFWLGIGGLGAGEEDDNEKGWEVSMHLDSGCHEHLKARSEGNPGWKRLPSVTCIPNKQQNPMMWPFDAPGKTWLHDSTDSSRDPGQWPYKSTDLRNFVESAPPSPAWADGIWYNASVDSRLIVLLQLFIVMSTPDSAVYILSFCFGGQPVLSCLLPAFRPPPHPALPQFPLPRRHDSDPPVGSMPAEDDGYWDQFDRAGDSVWGHGSAPAPAPAA
jgi:hypothetical protein